MEVISLYYYFSITSLLQTISIGFVRIKVHFVITCYLFNKQVTAKVISIGHLCSYPLSTHAHIHIYVHTHTYAQTKTQIITHKHWHTYTYTHSIVSIISTYSEETDIYIASIQLSSIKVKTSCPWCCHVHILVSIWYSIYFSLFPIPGIQPVVEPSDWRNR